MSIYKIAVCEDEDTIRDDMMNMCQEILAEENTECSLDGYASAEELEQVVWQDRNRYDLLILDIQMGGMSGIEFSKKLRQYDNRVSIIFVTSCEYYLAEGYEVQPIHFLLKPIDKEKLAEAVRTDLKINHRKKSVVIHMKGKMVSLKLADTIYIESLNHSLTVHSRSDSTVFWMTLSELERQLPSDQFSRCHNSYIVNLDYVSEISRSWLVLKNGEKLPVGRMYYKTFQQAFVRYMNA